MVLRYQEKKEKPVYERGRKELGKQFLTWTSIIANLFFVVLLTSDFLSKFAHPREVVYVQSEAQQVQRVVDTVRVMVQPPEPTLNDTIEGLIFYKIPADSLIRYAELVEACNGGNGQHGFVDVNNQRRWSWLRNLTGNDLEPYRRNGIYYTWVRSALNSNTVVISNTGQFEWDNDRKLEEFIAYQERQR